MTARSIPAPAPRPPDRGAGASGCELAFAWEVALLDGSRRSVEVVATDVDRARVLACQLATTPEPGRAYPEPHDLTPVGARLLAVWA